jgi:hypothetical protein
MTKSSVTLFALALTVSGQGSPVPSHRPSRIPRFVPHEIATGITGGYQEIAADLNRDGKPDLVAIGESPEIVWFENPSWTRHVLASGLTDPINVAAADIDGDGVPEIAVAFGFSTRPDQSSGNIAMLTHGADPAQLWIVREIDRNAASHRLRWYVDRDGQRWLMDAPLAAATAKPPNYDGPTPIYAYRAPDFKREIVTSEEFGVVHAIEPSHAPFCDACLLTAGFAGIHRYEHANGAWTHSAVVAGHSAPVPKGGSSEVSVGRALPSATANNGGVFLAAIEPWHGNEVVIYRPSANGSFARQVIDTTVVDGHTLVTADLDGDGVDEVIVGQRGGSRSLWAYATSSSGAWTRTTLDDGGMAGAGCIAVDVNADSRIDVVCIGTATANLKWYENQAAARRN